MTAIIRQRRIRDLLRRLVGQRVQVFSRFGGLWAVRIALQDFTPGGAVVGKLLRRPIEKRDALVVVAIEAVEVLYPIPSRSESVPIFL
jgi:hypothetical protein